MKLPHEWSELIDSLCSHRVRLIVDPTRANARRLGAALAQYGYAALAKEWPRFAERDRMATLGREPLRMDIMTSISGVDFRGAWKGRLRAKDLLDIALLDEVE